MPTSSSDQLIPAQMMGSARAYIAAWCLDVVPIVKLVALAVAEGYRTVERISELTGLDHDEVRYAARKLIEVEFLA